MTRIRLVAIVAACAAVFAVAVALIAGAPKGGPASTADLGGPSVSSLATGRPTMYEFSTDT
jgi:hypothetical protein